MPKNQNKKFWQFSNIGSNQVGLRIEGEIIDDDWVWLYEWLEISATSTNAFRNELAEHKGKQVEVWIDSIGGSVFAGAGMYNALKNHDGKVTVVVEKALSAAATIAMAGDEIQISPVGIMMIHNPVGYGGWGEAKEFRKAADTLDVVKETILNAYVLKTGKDRDLISKMMDDETYMSAQKAVAEGFADSVMYTDNGKQLTDGLQNSFSFSRLVIQNSLAASAQKILEMTQHQAKGEQPEKPVENTSKKQEGSIMTLEELRTAHPELVAELENSARAEGVKNGVKTERERIQGIEAIAKNIDPTLVAKAKYGEPVDAKDLAFQALQADAGLAKDYLDKSEEDNKRSGVDDVKAQVQTPGDSQEPQSITGRFKNVAAGLDARRRGVNQ